MLAYMLDTNICIHIIRDRPPELRERFNSEADRLCISSIALSELLFGAAKSAKPDANRPSIEDFAARLDVLPFDDDAAAHAGEIRVELERQGDPYWRVRHPGRRTRA
jgi:tRNA(fMet)-specific endonuclease VapC